MYEKRSFRHNLLSDLAWKPVLADNIVFSALRIVLCSRRVPRDRQNKVAPNPASIFGNVGECLYFSYFNFISRIKVISCRFKTFKITLMRYFGEIWKKLRLKSPDFSVLSWWPMQFFVYIVLPKTDTVYVILVCEEEEFIQPSSKKKYKNPYVLSHSFAPP